MARRQDNHSTFWKVLLAEEWLYCGKLLRKTPSYGEVLCLSTLRACFSVCTQETLSPYGFKLTELGVSQVPQSYHSLKTDRVTGHLEFQ